MIQEYEDFVPKFCKRGHDITNPKSLATNGHCRICRREMQASPKHYNKRMYRKMKTRLALRIARKRHVLDELREYLDEEED